MFLSRKSFDENNKLELLTVIIKNNNRMTIENFDATPLLDVVDNDYDTIIELLKQQKCEPLTQAEARAIELYGRPHNESFDITPEEFDYAVKNGLSIRQLDEMRNLFNSVKDYKVNI